MTRNGKIARMPYGIREELNRRLRDGKSGAALLKWLNEQEECLEVLEEEFESRPITKQNLSEWKQGGYKDWVRKEETRERVQVLMEKAEDLDRDAGGASIGDRVATLLEVELAVAMEQLDEIKDPKERWTRVKDITRELYRLRREDHHARRLRMAEEQYKRREQEAEKERLLKLHSAMKNKPMMASVDGNTDEARQWADWVIRVAHGLPMPRWWTDPKTAEEWSELLMPYWMAKAKGQGAKVEGKTSPKSKAQGPKSEPVRPRPTQRNRKSDKVRPSPGESKFSAKAESRNEKAEVEAPSAQAPSSREAPNSKIQEHGTAESDAQGREHRETGATEHENERASSDDGQLENDEDKDAESKNEE